MAKSVNKSIGNYASLVGRSSWQAGRSLSDKLNCIKSGGSLSLPAGTERSLSRPVGRLDAGWRMAKLFAAAETNSRRPYRATFSPAAARLSVAPGATGPFGLAARGSLQSQLAISNARRLQLQFQLQSEGEENGPLIIGLIVGLAPPLWAAGPTQSSCNYRQLASRPASQHSQSQLQLELKLQPRASEADTFNRQQHLPVCQRARKMSAPSGRSISLLNQ